jgi:hypothetical protein
LKISWCAQRNHTVLELELGIGALEIEPLSHLARRLADGVGHFVLVDLGNDVEARHRLWSGQAERGTKGTAPRAVAGLVTCGVRRRRAIRSQKKRAASGPFSRRGGIQAPPLPVVQA